jgi:hypothetical protein
MPRPLVSMDSIAARPWDRDRRSGPDPFAGSGRAKLTSAAARGAQRLQALQRANQVRVARAAVKHRIAAGEISVMEVIVSDAPEIETMAIIELLLSQRRWGYARCRGLLMAVPLSESKTVGSMTARQRTLLSELLADQIQPRPANRPA